MAQARLLTIYEIEDKYSISSLATYRIENRSNNLFLGLNGISARKLWCIFGDQPKKNSRPNPTTGPDLLFALPQLDSNQ